MCLTVKRREKEYKLQQNTPNKATDYSIHSTALQTTQLVVCSKKRRAYWCNQLLWSVAAGGLQFIYSLFPSTLDTFKILNKMLNKL